MSDETELVAILRLSTDQGSQAFNLDDDQHAANLLDEIRDLFDGSYYASEVDNDEDEPWLTVAVVRKPAGYVESLPEFEGW